MSDDSQRKKKSKTDIPTVLTAARPPDCAPESLEAFELVAGDVFSSPPTTMAPACEMVDDRPRDVVFTGDERMHDADIDVHATYSQSTDTPNYQSANSVNSFSLRELQNEALRFEPSTYRMPLVGDCWQLLDEHLPSFELLSAADLHRARSASVPVSPSQAARLITDVAEQDSKLINDVIADVIDQYLHSRPLDTALSIHLRPFHPLTAPRLQIHLRPAPIEGLDEDTLLSQMVMRKLQLISRMSFKSAESMGDFKNIDEFSTAEGIEIDSETTTYEPVQATVSNEICYVPSQCVPPPPDNESQSESPHLANQLRAAGQSVLELFVGRGRGQLTKGSDADGETNRVDDGRRGYIHALVAKTVFLASKYKVKQLKLKKKRQSIKCQLGCCTETKAVVYSPRATRHTAAFLTRSQLNTGQTETVLIEDFSPAPSPSTDLLLSTTIESGTQTNGDGSQVVVSVSLEVNISFVDG